MMKLMCRVYARNFGNMKIQTDLWPHMESSVSLTQNHKNMKFKHSHKSIHRICQIYARHFGNMKITKRDVATYGK